MKTNIDLTKDFTMGDIMSTEFFLYFKNYIKEMVEDQKIAKRDRKDEKHPCPEKRNAVFIFSPLFPLLYNSFCILPLQLSGKLPAPNDCILQNTSRYQHVYHVQQNQKSS